jgi:hypothetical protein
MNGLFPRHAGPVRALGALVGVLALAALSACSPATRVAEGPGSASSPPAATALAASATLNTIDCGMQRQGDRFVGTCSVPCSVNALAVNFDGLDTKRACNGPARVVQASLATTSVPNRWLGAMQGVQPEDPTRFEVVPAKVSGPAVARMPFGWFAVREVQQTGDRLALSVDARRQVRPTSDDLAILDRAVALVPDAARWNKEDNRQCAPEARKLSLFCALMQATTEVSGGVHYRQPAMQAVREELNKVDPARIKTHRIMDYNNHADTTLDEVHALLKRARARVAQDLR